MRDEYASDGWCCVDCLILLANGEDPVGTMSEDEIAAWHADIDRITAGYNLTLGMLREQHSCTADFNGQTAGEVGRDCDCETITFSRSPCDVCGSGLAGERHAVAFWKITEN